MRTICFIALLFSCAAYAETQEEKVRKCDKQGEAAAIEAVKKTPMKHPDDVTDIKRRAKRDEVAKCLRVAGMASGPIRAQ